ncbi:MAG: hypothetical protein Q8916_05290 [Bacteroidota bacterium]|nr:hypothetical protein [Bacteroidota bacterium]MDP4229803.1 hypothetical protein [Bacteroidota bacterium]MDP4236299.1 hypothetical protein [Bacteroidota bacterium]
MNTFFSSLFKINGANVLKTISGIGTGLLTAAGLAEQIPGLPPVVSNIASIIVGIATVLSAHGLHLADPPKNN